MAGAVALAGMAALRGGAGRVRLAVPNVLLDTVAGFEPSYMTTPLPADAAGRIASGAFERIVELAESATVVACGPGLGRSFDLDQMVLRLYRGLAKPMVFDADALNALATVPDALAKPGGPRILTPHPGEFARLIGKPWSPSAQRSGRSTGRPLRHRRGAKKPPHVSDRRRPTSDQRDGQSRHGHRRHGRRANGPDYRVFLPASRTVRRRPARRSSAWPRRRFGRRRIGRGVVDRKRLDPLSAQGVSRIRPVTPAKTPGLRKREARAVALLPPTSLAYNTKAKNPSTTNQLQHLDDPNKPIDVSISR